MVSDGLPVAKFIVSSAAPLGATEPVLALSSTDAFPHSATC